MIFQFHKVRLKAFRGQEPLFVPRQFQFHKVRLKGYYEYSVPVDHITFQFHKVRLKDMLSSLFLMIMPISIPQGSIKSQRNTA